MDSPREGDVHDPVAGSPSGASAAQPKSYGSTLVEDAVPDVLRRERRWVLWGLELRKGKLTKVPYNAGSGQRASSTDPQTWTDFESVVRAFRASQTSAPGAYNGVGFVLGDGYAGVDLDDCRDPATGELAEWAQQVVQYLNTYTEASPSGTGSSCSCAVRCRRRTTADRLTQRRGYWARSRCTPPADISP